MYKDHEQNSSGKIISLVAVLSIIVIIALGASFITYSLVDSEYSGAASSNTDGEASGGGSNKNNNKIITGDPSNKGDDELGDDKAPNQTLPPGGGGNVNTGELAIVYTEETNGIFLKDAVPISDAAGKALRGTREYFDFIIDTKVSTRTKMTYEIAIIKDPASTLRDDQVKLYLERKVGGTYVEVMPPRLFKPISIQTDLGSPKGSMVIRKETKTYSSNDIYRLRMWISSDAVITAGQHYKVKVNVYGKATYLN
jgi:hypothetical protein